MPLLLRGRASDRHERKEPVAHELLDLAASDLGGDRAGDDAAAPARHLHRDRLGLARERRSFASRHCITSVCQRTLSSFPASAGEPRLDAPRERDVHVVAAEQQVVADGDALEPEAVAVGAARDQREVGGAAADVDDQDMRSPPSSRFPAPLVRGEPGVERGLRLLEQRRAPARPGFARRRDGELARHLVERRRHGEHDVLLGERLVGMRRVPHGAEVREEARRRGDRREARHVVRRAPGQDRARCDRRRRGRATTSPR